MSLILKTYIHDTLCKEFPSHCSLSLNITLSSVLYQPNNPTIHHPHHPRFCVSSPSESLGLCVQRLPILSVSSFFWCIGKLREREREVYSFSQISTSVSRATITTGTHDNEGYLDRNSNPDTTSLLPIIHSFDLSSARSRENPEPHKTTWGKASPQALRPSPPHCLRDRVKNSIIRKPSGKFKNV